MSAVRFEARRFSDLTAMEVYEVLCLRDEVFVVGQRVTAEAEADGKDPECVHLLGRDAEGRLVATARVFLDRDPAVVGRVAVRTDLQRRGIGTALMEAIHGVLGARPAAMSAQAHLVPWYERIGWRAVGPVYDEAGIPHRRMRRGHQA